MKNILDIMKIVKCDEATAFAIFNLMELDFSGCTKAEFKREALNAARKVVK